MKKMILLGALAVSFATTSTQGQSVEELLGLNGSAAQTPAEPTLTGHAQAEEAPLYFRATVNPLIVGAISLQRAGSNGGATSHEFVGLFSQISYVVIFLRNHVSNIKGENCIFFLLL